MLKTISLIAHWYRRTQKGALRPHGELFRPSVEENWAKERINVVLWNKHVCKNFSDLLHISSITRMQLHKSGSKWQCVLYGRFHMRLKALCHAVQKAARQIPKFTLVETNAICSKQARLRNDLYCVEWGVKLYSNQTNQTSKQACLDVTGHLTKEAHTSLICPIKFPSLFRNVKPSSSVSVMTCPRWGNEDTTSIHLSST